MNRKQGTRLLIVVLLTTLIAPATGRPLHAQSGCALRINEVMYNPPSGSSPAEWVELYVATDISTPADFHIDDLETGSGHFSKTFTLPVTGLNPVPAGTYIIIHNDSGTDGTIVNNGVYTSVHFYAGNGSARLQNAGDDIALYVGTDTSSIPCDYIAYGGTSGHSINGAPTGFTWLTTGLGGTGSGTCGNPSSSQGISVSITPNGKASDDSCDWVASGSGNPLTQSPHSEGYNNNTSPTVVVLHTLAAHSSTWSGLPLARTLFTLGLLALAAGLLTHRRRPV